MGKKKKLKKRMKCLGKNVNFILKDMITLADDVEFCQQQIDIISDTLPERTEDTEPTIIVKEDNISSIDEVLFEQRVLQTIAKALSR